MDVAQKALIHMKEMGHENESTDDLENEETEEEVGHPSSSNNETSPDPDPAPVIVTPRLSANTEIHRYKNRHPTPILDYFVSIFAFDLSPNAGYLPSIHVYHDPDAHVKFAAPNELPQTYTFSPSQEKDGILVTISTVEAPDRVLIFDHESSGRLMKLETDMNQFYGHYLMAKAKQGREPEFQMVKNGYYAVYREDSNCWARCFVMGLAVAPNMSKLTCAEQRIIAILFDYDSEPGIWARKQFLPLKRAFLHIPVQKVRAFAHPANKKEFPWSTFNIRLIRQCVENKQFEGLISDYNAHDQPIPSLTLQLYRIVPENS